MYSYSESTEEYQNQNWYKNFEKKTSKIKRLLEDKKEKGLTNRKSAWGLGQSNHL